MTGYGRSLINAARGLINSVNQRDTKELEEFYKEEVPDVMVMENQFTDDIESHLARSTNFNMAPDPPSVLNWVLKNFPENLPDMEEGSVVHIPVKIAGGLMQESLEPVGPNESVIICHVELHLTSLSRAGRLIAVVGERREEGVMVRASANGIEASRPLLVTSGEPFDRFLAGRHWLNGLVDESCEPTDDMVFWFRSLRGILTLIDAAHVFSTSERWTIYRCLLDHCSTHYLIPTDLSDKILRWERAKHSPLRLDADLKISTHETDLDLEGTLFVVYFTPNHVAGSSFVDIKDSNV